MGAVPVRQMLFHRDLEENLRLQEIVGHHMRLGAKKEELETLFDRGEFTEIELPENVTDPLKFRDRKRYSDRLKETRNATGGNDAIIVAHGAINGHKTVVAVFDFFFYGWVDGNCSRQRHRRGRAARCLQEAAFVVVHRRVELACRGHTIADANASDDHSGSTGQRSEASYIVLLADPTTGGVSRPLLCWVILRWLNRVLSLVLLVPG